MGRSGFCSCQEVLWWISDTSSSHTSQHLFDPYSFSHVQHGMLFAGLFWAVLRRHPLRQRWALAGGLGIEAVWEIVENTPFVIERYRTATISLHYFGDSIANSIGDLLCCALGIWWANRLPSWVTLLCYVTIEIGMLLTIRDSLTLNVIMLLSPLETIREWQSGVVK